jgi:PilZ domain
MNWQRAPSADAPDDTAKKAEMDDRRSVRRTHVRKKAKVLVNRSSIPCTVVDLTNRGACISFANAREIPDRFELTFGSGQARRACRVTWRANNLVGVAFDASDVTPGSA